MRFCSYRPALLLCSTLLTSWLSIPAYADDLIVSAAGSLTKILPQVSAGFESTHPGVTVQYNFGASGNLLQQIAAGAPADVFFSASVPYMTRGEDKGWIKRGSSRNIVGNQVVVAVPATSTRKIDNLQSLLQPGVKRIAFGNSAMPNARYSESALKAAGLWKQLQPKFVFCATVVQAVNYVAQNDVDAGFIFATDAVTAGKKVRVAFVVPVKEPIVYPAGVVAKAPHPKLAEEFIQYLQSAKAQAIFHHYGFLPVVKPAL